MAGDGTSFGSVKPVTASAILRREQRDLDCTLCRLIGGTAFIGVGGYTYYEGMKQLERKQAQIKSSRLGMGPRKAGLAGISCGLLWMGIYRLFG